MKLELKHLAGYLPYSLKMYWEDMQGVIRNPWTLKLENVDFVLSNQNKPILRPLSDLIKEIEVNGEKFVPIEWFEVGEEYNEDFPFVVGDSNIRLIKDLEIISKYNVHNDVNYLPFCVIQKLLEWHFDIYGLIEKGLAIDINTL